MIVMTMIKMTMIIMTMINDDDGLRFGLRVVGVDGGNACARVLWLLPGSSQTKSYYFQLLYVIKSRSRGPPGH